MFYLIIHGTNNLFIVNKINSIVPIVPRFNGFPIHSFFVRNYLVDFLWCTSLTIILSTIYENKYIILSLIFAVTLESLQFISPHLGTFDFFDILLYLITGGIFLIFRYIKLKKTWRFSLFFTIFKIKGVSMSFNKKTTSQEISAMAAKILSDKNSSKTARSLAGSALSQSEKGKQTGAEMENLASTVLKSLKYNRTTQTLAGSVLAQANKER